MSKKNILIQDISKTYEGVKVLKNINLEIKAGEFFSILGPSGCGKTTLLRMIAGFTEPDKGAIYLGDQNLLDLPPNRRNVNTIFQKYALFPHLTVYENVAFSLRIQKKNQKEIDEEVMKFLKMVGLEEHRNKKPSQLSGGQQQRVAIVRALINKPEVLLLDEPLSALDAKLRQNLLIELDAIHEEVGITFIFITHDQQEALSVSDRIAVMNKGEILQVGTPAEVYEAPSDLFVADFIGENNFFSGVVTEILHENYARIDSLELGDVVIEQDKKVQVGDRVKVSIRPEKIKISKSPHVGDWKQNSIKVWVDELIYSGFQSKYFMWVKGNRDIVFKAFKQHAVYHEDTDAGLIKWNEEAYISWDSDDGFLVEVIPFEK